MKTSKGCIICDPTRDQYLMNTAGFFPPFFFWKSPLQCFLSTCQTYNCFPTSFEMKAQSLLKKMMYLETAWVHVSAPKKTQSIILSDVKWLTSEGFQYRDDTAWILSSCCEKVFQIPPYYFSLSKNIQQKCLRKSLSFWSKTPKLTSPVCIS